MLPLPKLNSRTTVLYHQVLMDDRHDSAPSVRRLEMQATSEEDFRSREEEQRRRSRCEQAELPQLRRISVVQAPAADARASSHAAGPAGMAPTSIWYVRCRRRPLTCRQQARAFQTCLLRKSLHMCMCDARPAAVNLVVVALGVL